MQVFINQNAKKIHFGKLISKKKQPPRKLLLILFAGAGHPIVVYLSYACSKALRAFSIRNSTTALRSSKDKLIV